MNSLGVYYWYVKMPRWGCVEHGLEYIAFYVQSYAHLKACSGHPLVRNGQLGAPAFVKLAYSNTMITDALVTQGARMTAAFFLHDRPWISPWVRYHYSRDHVTIVWSLWRHQQSIVTSSTERKPSEWDMRTMCKDRHFYRHLWIRCVV